MLKTELCALLGIGYPILQAGMAWVSDAELASAVSNAGALGILAAGNKNGEEVREEIRKTRSMTSAAFGVNIMLLSPFADEVMRVVLEERPAVAVTGAGNPGKYVPALKEKGIIVVPVVPSVALAKRLEKLGVDALIAEGTEAGGHIGELTTFVLVPQIANAVKIPVVAAGGIADGRGLAAALALGAKGVQIGTRFICTEECTAHAAFKKAIIEAGDRDTTVTGRPTGHPVRMLKNKLSKQFHKLEEERAPFEEYEKLGSGKLKAAVVDGDIDYGSVMAGQVAAMVNEIKPVKEVIEEITAEAVQVIKRLKDCLLPSS